MKFEVTVATTINCPRVPNFLQQANGQWIPLCALSEAGIRELGRAWVEACIERAVQQNKDPDFFYRNAVKGEP
jgi:hypothetical protein